MEKKHRNMTSGSSNPSVLQMQKALTEIKVGYSGPAIIWTILAGERDALKLARMKQACANETRRPTYVFDSPESGGSRSQGFGGTFDHNS